MEHSQNFCGLFVVCRYVCVDVIIINSAFVIFGLCFAGGYSLVFEKIKGKNKTTKPKNKKETRERKLALRRYNTYVSTFDAQSFNMSFYCANYSDSPACLMSEYNYSDSAAQ